jgi:hypothetical protein
VVTIVCISGRVGTYRNTGPSTLHRVGSPQTGLAFRTLTTDRLMHVYHESDINDSDEPFVQAIGNHPPHPRVCVRLVGCDAMCVPCAVAMEEWPEHRFRGVGDLSRHATRTDSILLDAVLNSTAEGSDRSPAALAEAALVILNRRDNPL